MRKEQDHDEIGMYIFLFSLLAFVTIAGIAVFSPGCAAFQTPDGQYWLGVQYPGNLDNAEPVDTADPSPIMEDIADNLAGILLSAIGGAGILGGGLAIQKRRRRTTASKPQKPQKPQKLDDDSGPAV